MVKARAVQIVRVEVKVAQLLCPLMAVQEPRDLESRISKRQGRVEPKMLSPCGTGGATLSVEVLFGGKGASSSSSSFGSDSCGVC